MGSSARHPEEDHLLATRSTSRTRPRDEAEVISSHRRHRLHGPEVCHQRRVERDRGRRGESIYFNSMDWEDNIPRRQGPRQSVGNRPEKAERRDHQQQLPEQQPQRGSTTAALGRPGRFRLRLNTAPANKMLTYYSKIPSDKQDFHARRLEPKCCCDAPRLAIARWLLPSITNLLIKFSWWYFVDSLARIFSSSLAGGISSAT